jgi:hypothetical protein
MPTVAGAITPSAVNHPNRCIRRPERRFDWREQLRGMRISQRQRCVMKETGGQTRSFTVRSANSTPLVDHINWAA